jgi:hypothetical protein
MKFIVLISLSSLYYTFPFEKVGIRNKLDASSNKGDPRLAPRTFGLIKALLSADVNA